MLGGGRKGARVGVHEGRLAADARRRRVEGGGPLRLLDRRTRRVVASFWQNLGKMLLVFGCIGPDFCKKICVLQHFSKSTRFSN